MANEAFIYDPEAGKVFSIDSNDLVKELRGGAQLATPEQIQRIKTRRLLDERYGSGSQQALGVAEEVAGTLTFGASRMAQRAFGADEEGLQERSDRVSPVVTGASMLVPALVSGGTSALVQGGAKGLAKAGAKELAKEAVEVGAKTAGRGVLAEAAGLSAPGAIFAGEQAIARAIAPAGSGVLRQAAGQAVGGAVGGVAVTAGELINETAIGRPPELGEDLVSRIGMNALLGGAGGAAFELGAGAVSAGAKAARKAANKTWAEVIERYPKHAKKILGEEHAPAIDELMATRTASSRGNAWVDDAVRKNRPPVDDTLPDVPAKYTKGTMPDDIKPSRVKEVIDEADVDAVGDALQQQLKATREASDTLFDTLRPAEREALGNVSAINHAAAKDEATSLMQRGAKIAADLAEDPLKYGSVTKSFNEALASAATRLKATDGVVGKEGLGLFEALDELKRDISERGLAGKSHEIRKFYKDIQGSLEQPELWDKLAIRQKDLNAAYTRYSAVARPKQKGGITRLLFKEEKDAAGKTNWVVDRHKLKRILSKADTPEGAADLRRIGEWMSAERNLVDQIEESAKHLPGQFERSTVDAAMAKARSNFDGAVDVTRSRARLTEELAGKREAFKQQESAAWRANRAEIQAAQDARKSVKAAVKAEDLAVREQARALTGADKPAMPSLAFGLGLGIGVHPILGVPYAALRLRSFLDSPAKAIRAMSLIENASVSVNNAIEKLAKGVAAGGRVVARTGSFAGTATYAKNAEQQRRKYDERIDMIRQLGGNPELLAERLDDAVSGFGEDAPETALAAQTTAVRFVSFMANQIPPEPNMGAFGGKWVTPNNVAAAFNRTFDVAAGGAPVLLEMAREGNVLPADVEAFRAVYPEQHARVTEALLANVMLRDLSGKTLQTVKTLLGEPVTAAQQPASVASLQAVYATNAQGQGVPMSHKGATVDLSRRMRTGVDADGPVGERGA